MTGMQQSLAALGNLLGFSVNAVSDIQVTPTLATGSINLQAQGNIVYVGNASSGAASWYSPATPGIGSSYWSKLTLNSGTAPTAGPAPGTVISMAVNGNALWSWQSTAGQIKTANCTISVYSDAAGTVLISSATFNVDVRST